MNTIEALKEAMSKLDASTPDTIKPTAVAMLHIVFDLLQRQGEVLQKQDAWLSGLDEMLKKRDAVIVELARRSPEKIEAFLKLSLNPQELEGYMECLIEPVEGFTPDIFLHTKQENH
jgi:hypothetical protein